MADHTTPGDGQDSTDTELERPSINALGFGSFDAQFVHASIDDVAVRVQVHMDGDGITLGLVAGQDDPSLEVLAKMSHSDAADLGEYLCEIADDARTGDSE